MLATTEPGNSHFEEAQEDVQIVDGEVSWDEECVEVVIACSDALKSLANVEQFLQGQDDGWNYMRKFEKIRQFVVRKRNDNFQQPSITAYFNTL